MIEFICGAIYKVKGQDESYGMMLATEKRSGKSHGLFQRFGHAPVRICAEYNGGFELELVSVPGVQTLVDKTSGRKKRVALDK